ncbi:hypothetical protein F5J12DRAFT_935062 [Pisolithus orientalis]|uniref:uncharacterized protein n=1 Tax=Pisolithus orientalis TaxID=936130 RepID=UPI0022244DFA|nr:uncharacterized protein F5J12DRAFT_935062 [Pisolithus orientalis]KAI6009637.1 hypothetical protein F5J12DRAFT_935062 [Pisolithus orientalis]
MYDHVAERSYICKTVELQHALQTVFELFESSARTVTDAKRSNVALRALSDLQMYLAWALSRSNSASSSESSGICDSADTRPSSDTQPYANGLSWSGHQLNKLPAKLGGQPGAVPSTGAGFGEIASQPSGYPGARPPASLQSQQTGFHVSGPHRLLQQSFQQHNQQHGRGPTPKVPWALSKPEKKSYDQIFRPWDAQGTGFIGGQTALEAFGQSGLDRNDLAKIWQLNLAEFHVAMGIIYCKIPDELPPEFVPPSSRDLDTSVSFLKDILKNDTCARSPSALDTPVSRLKERSFTSSSTTLTQQGGRQDATVYRYQDVPPPGMFYQSSVRHIDRNAVRSQSDESNPAASDIASLKRQLLNTQKMLDDNHPSERESDQLDRDLKDLRYGIKRLQEVLEYVSHVPELERKVEERKARREKERRKWANERDKRNERFGRFAGEEGSRYSPAPESRYGTEDDRPYSRCGSRYEKDERDYYDRDGKKSYRFEESDRQLHQESTVDTRFATRSVPTATPAVPSVSRVNSPPRAAPAPSRSPASQLKNMTPAQRKAYIQAQAKRSTRKGEKAREAERQAEEREQVRKLKLEAEQAIKEGKGLTPTPTPTTIAPAPSPAKAASPPPKPRTPAPPPPRKGTVPRTPAAVAAPALPVQASVPAPASPAPAEPEEDPEDVALRAREAALRKKREEREALLRKLEEEEKMNEEAYQQRRNQFFAVKAAASPAVSTVSSTQNSAVPPAPPAPPVPPALRVHTPPAVVSVQPAPEVEAEEAAFPPPPPLPPPPAPPASTPADKPSNNPFNRLKKDVHAPAPETTPSPVNVGNSNPLFRSQTAPPPSVPTPPKSPGVPPPVKTTYYTKEDDGSSDEELATRDTRVGLAQQLFGGLLPARPQSAGPAPPPPPPPVPAVPAPSKSPTPVAPSAAPGDRSSLLSAIQGGAVLRKTVTNDRSAAATAGRIIGDNTLPAHVSATPRSPSPPSPPAPAAPVLPVTEASEPPQVELTSTSKHRPKESVDWYDGLPADHAGRATLDRLPEAVEEEEYAGDVPDIRVSEHVPDGGSDPMSDVDESTSLRVRSLYAYEAQRTEDLSFGENIVIEAHPSKSGGDWWYGTTASNGRSGFFPQTYVQVLEPVQATALYSYEGSGPDELSFNEGDVLIIVDRVESDWWRAERDGVVYAVPAAYMEVAEDRSCCDYDWCGYAVQLSGRYDIGEGRDLQPDGDEKQRVDGADPDCEMLSNDGYGTPFSSLVKTRKLDRIPEITGIDDDEDDDNDDYYSLDDDSVSDVSEASDADATQTFVDQEKQEMERRSYRQQPQRSQSFDEPSAACQ